MTTVDLSASSRRSPSVAGVDEMFIGRWSPRAMSGVPLTWEELAPLFEAARWAPSSMNAQPWRFVVTLRDDENWQAVFELLAEGNQKWVANAGALVLVTSRSRFERNDMASVTHSFDAGAAWMSMALQARLCGLVAHGMQGFDYDRAREVLNVPEVYAVEAMIALGRPGDVEDLPEAYQEREVPSDRKPLDEIVLRGSFPAG